MGEVNGFCRQFNGMSLGITAASVMSDCEQYGIVNGCNERRPVLISGKCDNEESNEYYKKLKESEDSNGNKIIRYV